MESIIIGFSKPRSFGILAWLIMVVERSEFSHVYMKTYSKSLDRWLIYQASGTKVNFIGQEKFYEHNESVKEYLFDVNPESKTKFLVKAVDTVGTPYGVKQLIGIGLVRLGKVFGLKLTNPFRDNRATYVCSELAAEVLEEITGINIGEDLDTIGPKELDEIIMNRE